MEQGFFITGTDTNVGKTWSTVALMQCFKGKGKSVIGLKPVASGCFKKNGQLVNDDALLLSEKASVKLDYDSVNPYAFELSASPHIAGKENPVNLAVIIDKFNAIKHQAEVILVEGAGGWYSPLNETEMNSDLAMALGLPVIIVVAIKLGGINHAKLTYQAILNSKVPCLGWIAVFSNPDTLFPEETVSSIKDLLDVPLIGILPYMDTPDFAMLATSLTVEKLYNFKN